MEDKEDAFSLLGRKTHPTNGTRSLACFTTKDNERKECFFAIDVFNHRVRQGVEPLDLNIACSIDFQGQNERIACFFSDITIKNNNLKYLSNLYFATPITNVAINIEPEIDSHTKKKGV